MATTIIGTIGDDAITQQAGGPLFEDLVLALAGNDSISTSEGDDIVLGMGDHDSIFGGAGNDVLFGDSALGAVIIGGERCRHDDDDDDDDDDDGDGDGDLNTQCLIGIIKFVLDNPNSKKFPPELIAALLDPGFGDDVIFGGDGDDQIFGGPGTDAIIGGNGSDRMFGGDGNDLFLVVEDDGTNTPDYIDGGAGTADVVSYFASVAPVTVNLANTALNTGAAAGDTYVGIEGVRGAEGGGNFLTGDANDNILVGGDGTGIANADVLDGAGGADVLFGGDGPDVLVGGDGTDLAFGGGGNDLFISGDDGGAADTWDGGAGTGDVVSYFSASAGVTANLANQALNTGAAAGEVYIGIEGLRGSAAGSNHLTGDGNDNVLVGEGHADELFGGDGNDTLFGGGGDDSLFGGDGSDLLRGRTGDDMLTGGAGADFFVLATDGAGDDTITDFEVGLDKVQFTISGVNSFADLVFSDLGGGDSQVTAGSVSVTFLGVDVADINNPANFDIF